MDRKCPNCGTINKGYMNYCKNCGTPLDIKEIPQRDSNLPRIELSSKGEKICPRCGVRIEEEEVYCKYCGFRLIEEEETDFDDNENTVQSPPIFKDYQDLEKIKKKEPIKEKKKQPRLVTILKDGERGQVFPLLEGVTDIGREEGNILIPDDPYISPRHARIIKRDGRYYIQDLMSLNGIYFQIREPVGLNHGDYILIGTQLLKFEILDEVERGLGPAKHYGTYLFGTPMKKWVARLLQMTTEGIPRNVYYLYGKETIIGRETGNIVFPDDPYVSKRHARIIHDSASHKFIIEDLGSSNGTNIRFRGEREIVHGDIFRIGHHLFKFEIV